MRLIDANALKYKNLAEVNGRLTYVLTAEDIDNAPTVAVNCKDCDGYEAGYSAGLKDAERPHGEFTRKELESWLYRIADHNFGNELGRSCEEIISRLDGFERYVSDMRKGDISCE